MAAKRSYVSLGWTGIGRQGPLSILPRSGCPGVLHAMPGQAELSTGAEPAGVCNQNPGSSVLCGARAFRNPKSEGCIEPGSRAGCQGRDRIRPLLGRFPLDRCCVPGHCCSEPCRGGEGGVLFGAPHLKKEHRPSGHHSGGKPGC